MVTWEPLGDFIWNDLYADGVYIYVYEIMNSPIKWLPTIYSQKNPKITLGGRM